MPSPVLVADAGFVEVGDRIWVARHSWCDVNVTLVEGGRGLLLVDTLASQRAGTDLVGQIRRSHAAQVVAVVNTHDHLDHTSGNAAVRAAWPSVPVHAHEEAAAPLADHTLASVAVVDLGDRVVELVHPGRGHTAGDLVVRVPDADVLVAGDLVREAGPPAYGEDCFPLDWPAALDFVVDLLTPGSVVVPGHGSPVDQRFVTEQRGDVGAVAEAIFDLASRSVPLEEALTDGLRETAWPFPADRLGEAVRRGYAQVPRTARRLPMV